MRLWDRELVVIAGKGGVGRTTTAACLGLAAASAGRAAAVAELHGAGSVAELFGLGGRAYRPRRVAEGLDTLSLSTVECLDDFGHYKLRLTALVRLVFHNRLVTTFLDAVPGMHDIMQLGKLRNLLRDPDADDPRYDVVVIDAPATGHGLTLLGAARSMAEMTRVGPFFDEAKQVEVQLSDPAATAIVLVTLPEELPIHESIEFLEALGAERALVAAIVVNQVEPLVFPDDSEWFFLRQTLASSASPSLARVLALADETVALQQRQRAAIAELREGARRVLGRDVPIATLPTTPGPPTADDLPGLAARLHAQLDVAT